jgi:hypothetical protein
MFNFQTFSRKNCSRQASCGAIPNCGAALALVLSGGVETARKVEKLKAAQKRPFASRLVFWTPDIENRRILSVRLQSEFMAGVTDGMLAHFDVPPQGELQTD